ncbi:MAG: tetratricopeptide repeat protein [Bryobacteraceae bacterium]
MRRWLALLLCTTIAAAPLPPDLRKARDTQDRALLDRLAAEAVAAAQARPTDAPAQYRAALAGLVRAEVALEQRDRNTARAAAEEGIRAAEKAVALKPSTADYHRVLGALCAQVIPANPLLGLRYGRCALEEVNRAVELDPKSADAWLSRGVGNFYLPESFGGGAEQALKDIDRALELDPSHADAWLWRGIVLRKLNRNAEAREAIQKSLKLNPARLWARQQLEKTPAQ